MIPVHHKLFKLNSLGSGYPLCIFSRSNRHKRNKAAYCTNAKYPEARFLCPRKVLTARPTTTKRLQRFDTVGCASFVSCIQRRCVHAYQKRFHVSRKLRLVTEDNWPYMRCSPIPCFTSHYPVVPRISSSILSHFASNNHQPCHHREENFSTTLSVVPTFSPGETGFNLRNEFLMARRRAAPDPHKSVVAP